MDPVLIVTLSAELGLCIFTIKMHFIALFNTYLILCLKISAIGLKCFIREENYKYLFFTLAHGTFIGSMRLEAHKPTQVPLDSTLSFGASTRTYVLRERPPVVLPLITSEGDEEGVEGGTLLGLPELDNDLDVGEIVV